MKPCWCCRDFRSSAPALNCRKGYHFGMKVYFGFTVAGDRSSLEAAKKIVEILQSMGHQVLTKHLLCEDAWEADRRLPPEQIFARDMGWLAQCDIFVAEVSGSSFGLGFETGYLLGATRKKTILFYQRTVERKISLLIVGNTHPNCVSAPYSRLDELEELVRTCVSPEEIQSPQG
jgi:2'-deoxynucleoside 5'-phosphate N-hydrolase